MVARLCTLAGCHLKQFKPVNSLGRFRVTHHSGVCLCGESRFFHFGCGFAARA
jgi:hypothetical protein